jgi:CBS domain-containing protein
LGFAEVYDLAVGIGGWTASGRPTDGDRLRTGPRTAADVADRGVPVCAPDATVADVAAVIGHHPLCAVTVAGAPDGVVLGIVRREPLDLAPTTPVDDVLVTDPSTTRPDTPVPKVLDDMRQHGQDHLVVTTHDGHLVGLVSRADLDVS